MHSLNLKIALSFIFVSLIGVALAAFFIQQRTQTAFNRFLYDQDREAVVTALIQHYHNEGNWSNIETLLRQYPGWWLRNFGLPLPENGSRSASEPYQFPYTLVDTNGMVVFGKAARLGQPMPLEQISMGVPLEVDGQIVGWLLEARVPPRWERETPQGVFLATVNRIILLSALGALGVALLLGSVLARSLTQPLRELVTATQMVAKGKLGYSVKVRSQDEIGQLATSFNQMSADLAKANLLQKQTTANIAHDLRTPLSVIMGYTEALNDGKLQGSPEIFTTMHQMTQHLSRLIEDLRTLSLAEAGELPINLQRTPPALLLECAAAAYSSQAQVKNISLQVEAEPNLPLIEVDEDRMAQVLGNLISNALRYTPQGGWIKLTASADVDAVIITVQDNGAGIAPEDLPYVFNRFYRGDKARPQNGEAGLGLTITKSLVEAQGGMISVESELGQGTTFAIRFPIRNKD